jgi:hypothetical protein
MAGFALGLIALAAFLSVGWWFSRQKSAQASRIVRMLLGGGAVAAGAMLALRGALPLGIPIGLFGLGMLGIAINAPGQGGSQRPGPPPATNAMSLADAREILGVSADATREEIRHAHRQLMKKLHPDTGGSAALARQVQEARDILLAALKD